MFFGKNEYTAPHGMIDLAHCTTVKSADLKSKKRHSFEISTPDITYLLYADTEQEKDDWIGRVGKAIVRCSSTYYHTNPTTFSNTSTNNANNNNNHNHNNNTTNNPLYAANVGPGGYPTTTGIMGGRLQDEEDDDDILYEDPNNPNPYFND